MIDLKDKDVVATQYTPLVHKISRQIHYNCKGDYDDLVSYGYDGLMYAVDKYSEKTSQTFTQYASYMIRFHILNHINSGETKLIKMSTAVEKRENGKGRKRPTVSSLDTPIKSGPKGGDNTVLGDIIPGESDQQIYDSLSSDADTQWCKVFRALEGVFSDRDITIFYKRFGIAGWEVTKGVDIAKEYNTSSVNITNTCNKVIKYMRNNPSMMNILLDILQQTNI